MPLLFSAIPLAHNVPFAVNAQGAGGVAEAHSFLTFSFSISLFLSLPLLSVSFFFSFLPFSLLAAK